MGIISWLVVGAIAGYLAGFLVKGDESLGVIGHIGLGIVGGLVGGFLAGILTGGNDYTTGFNITTIVVAVIGAVILVVGYNLIRGRSRTGGGTV
jgi:uncharacterized membrane protein YeaQ/YmgE (transglycosylase-associated protein family)